MPVTRLALARPVHTSLSTPQGIHLYTFIGTPHSQASKLHTVTVRSCVWSSVCSFIVLPHFPGSPSSTSLTDNMKRKREETRHSSESLAQDVASLDISSAPCAAGDHPVTRHALTKKRAQSINSALALWFPTVHDTRGMPWRKPFDLTLSSEAKGQRAYEVCSSAGRC